MGIPAIDFHSPPERTMIEKVLNTSIGTGGHHCCVAITSSSVQMASFQHPVQLINII